MNLKSLIGSGDKIGLFVLPFLVASIILGVWKPSFFDMNGPSDTLKIISGIVLVFGVINWLWSVWLILTKVPRNELITYGPYSLMKHPIYTSVALFVLPWLGFVCNTWLGAAIGIILYIGSRIYSPEEERAMAQNFGAAWDEYNRKVKIPWL